MKWFHLIVAVVLALLLAGAGASVQKRGGSDVRFAELSISRAGVLSVVDQSKQYILLPHDRYPAELRGVALVDLDAQIYVARFFEPGGVGSEGFFDVCFQVKGKDIATALIENSASLERIGGATYVRSCSYVFDSGKMVLLKTGFSEAKPVQISFTKHLMPTANP